MSKRLLNTTEKGCLDIIKKWSEPTKNGMDGIWLGYNTLLDEMYGAGFYADISNKYIKDIVKRLYRAGYITYETTYNEDGQINGKGYFYRGAK